MAAQYFWTEGTMKDNTSTGINENYIKYIQGGPKK